jgi:hypothetical protein
VAVPVRTLRTSTPHKLALTRGYLEVSAWTDIGLYDLRRVLVPSRWPASTERSSRGTRGSPLSPERASRQITRIHQRSPGLPALPLLTCWPPSPCGRLSRPRTTTGPPPRPVPSADDVPALPACWPHTARAAPAGSHVHRKADRRVRRPALPLRHRHGYAAGIHHGLPAGVHMPAREFPATRRQRVRTAPSLYPPDLSWWAVKGRQALVPLVHLPVLLAGPAPSGSTSTSRHRQGCSRPPRRLPDQAALSFTRPL